MHWKLLALAITSRASAIGWWWPSVMFSSGSHKSHAGGSPAPDLEKANAVKEVFRTAWDGYKKHAFPHDDLDPKTDGYDDDRNGWGATAVDALDTAIIMEEADIVHEILDFIPTINFTTTPEQGSQISVFETTIRYLGGMLAAYDLLNGPYSHMLHRNDALDDLLGQSKTLADYLSVGFDTPSGFLDGTVTFNPEHKRVGQSTNSVAGAGTLILEWTRLSDLTGDSKYFKMADKCQQYIMDPDGNPDNWPGLVGKDLSTETGKFVNDFGSWSGGMDSYYEYLIKAYLYNKDQFTKNKDCFILAADSSIAHLASHPTTRPELTLLAGYDKKVIDPSSGHLASFAGGNFIFAGVLLDNQEYKDFGLQLTESYYATYNSTATGIGPEGFRWVDDSLPAGEGKNKNPPSDQEDFYNKAGFWVTSSSYILRPETMESIWYAWRLTGDTRYKDMQWEAFNAVVKYTRVGSGYTGISDVNDKDTSQKNKMYSFFLAEALKYLYMTFSEDSEVQFQAKGGNKWVFNTEAHPLRVKG